MTNETGVPKLIVEFRPSQANEHAVHDLLDEFRAIGFDPALTDVPEERARVVLEVIAIYVGMKVTDAMIAKVVEVVTAWFWRRVKEEPKSPPTLVLYGPDGQELKRVAMKKPAPPG